MLDKTTANIHQFKGEFVIEGSKALPAIGGAWYSSVTLNDAVAIATFAYIILQAAYLVWKWYKEARK